MHVLSGVYVGCQKDLDLEDVVVPAGGSVVGLGSHCWEVK